MPKGKSAHSAGDCGGRWGSLNGVVGRKQEKTRQVHVQEGQVEAALDQVKEGKEERDEKNDCQKTHLPNCLNYPSAWTATPSRYFAFTIGDSKPVLIRPDPSEGARIRSRTGSCRVHRRRSKSEKASTIRPVEELAGRVSTMPGDSPPAMDDPLYVVSQD